MQALESPGNQFGPEKSWKLKFIVVQSKRCE